MQTCILLQHLSQVILISPTFDTVTYGSRLLCYKRKVNWQTVRLALITPTGYSCLHISARPARQLHCCFCESSPAQQHASVSSLPVCIHMSLLSGLHLNVKSLLYVT